MESKNPKKAQVRQKKNYNKHIRLEPRFAADYYTFLERSPLIASPEDQAAYERHSKLLLGRRWPYLVISSGSECEKIAQDGIRNNISINRLTKVAKEAGLEWKLHPLKNKNRYQPRDCGTERKQKSFYAVERIVEHENRSTKTYYTVSWYGYGTREDMVEPAAYIPYHLWEAYWRRIRKITNVISIQEEQER